MISYVLIATGVLPQVAASTDISVFGGDEIWAT